MNKRLADFTTDELSTLVAVLRTLFVDEFASEMIDTGTAENLRLELELEVSLRAHDARQLRLKPPGWCSGDNDICGGCGASFIPNEDDSFEEHDLDCPNAREMDPDLEKGRE